jgi:hypothetical protein
MYVCKEVTLKVNSDKTKHMAMSRHENTKQKLYSKGAEKVQMSGKASNKSDFC